MQLVLSMDVLLPSQISPAGNYFRQKADYHAVYTAHVDLFCQFCFGVLELKLAHSGLLVAKVAAVFLLCRDGAVMLQRGQLLT